MSSTSKNTAKLKAAAIWVVILIVAVAGFQYFWKPSEEKKLATSTGSVSRYSDEVTIGLDAFNGYWGIRCSVFSDFLGSESIKLSYEDDGADYVARMKALKSGDLDMAVFTVDSFIAAGYEIGDFPATIVMVIDETKGADAIVAYDTAVKDLKGLNNKETRFVLTPNSPSQFLSEIIVTDVHLPNLPKKWIEEADGAADVLERFKKADKTEPKAYVLWQPYLSMALEEKGAHVIFGSDQLKGYIVDVLVASRKFLSEKPEVVKAVVKSYLRTMYSCKSDLVDLVIKDSAATGEKLSKKHAEDIIAGIEWKNTLDNYAHFRLISKRKSGGNESLEDMIEKITRIMGKTGSIDPGKIPESNTLFYDQIMIDLNSEKFHPAQGLGLIANASMDLDAAHEGVKVSKLSESEWKSLIPVAEMKVKKIYFKRGKAELTLQSGRNLEELAASLNSFPNYYILVIGSARASEDQEGAMRLAEDRAKFAAGYLGRRGVNGFRLKPVGKLSGKGGAAQSVTFQIGQPTY